MEMTMVVDEVSCFVNFVYFVCFAFLQIVLMG